MFIVDGSEPVDNRWGVFPLVEVVFIRDAVVDAVKDLFANFAYFPIIYIFLFKHIWKSASRAWLLIYGTQ